MHAIGAGDRSRLGTSPVNPPPTPERTIHAPESSGSPDQLIGPELVLRSIGDRRVPRCRRCRRSRAGRGRRVVVDLDGVNVIAELIEEGSGGTSSVLGAESDLDVARRANRLDDGRVKNGTVRRRGNEPLASHRAIRGGFRTSARGMAGSYRPGEKKMKRKVEDGQVGGEEATAWELNRPTSSMVLSRVGGKDYGRHGSSRTPPENDSYGGGTRYLETIR